ncbi:gamma-glutamyl-gamma-aminobutyrate hydrolase family protein [Actinobacteria bacterium YIM 96077]|uniref:Gamma-glutamyl-gamma-aminobutyrate hydrolase family protein n=1 Tax=Phytoactinopolyspora halophila TaxID=1981511 RepID=A0A329QB74_9ACTN|nr:gamma-glutamyl-gamma-aminobutyrate hydrolase family protein [Phytoactinopolyspora halophila]AYY12644.1 gamma-glutamyl-gamma-aminobutyrate hydrolase family protein [Actinobacteria bacterium YIM 96077]RAW09497.1 gamma-glutamyl-gamma-aminobutyrate hydrolase family protein [Phytoactinopolyspora halophila]
MNSASNGSVRARPSGGQPVIGICARTAPVTLQGGDITVSLALQSHVDFLASAGCMPVLLPLLPGVERVVGQLDGLLVPGGPDVDPALYGSAEHPETRRGSPVVDAIELELIRGALGSGLPVLAICRGMQLLNVCYGGTLHQHLPEVTGDDAHCPNTEGFSFGRHRLDLTAGSRIAAIFGDDTPEAYCHHHQAIDQVGTGLTVTAWAPDGIIEVVEVIDHPFAIGVQWEAGQTADERLHVALAEAVRRVSAEPSPAADGPAFSSEANS